MDIWRHGRYVDLWSFVHLLWGAMLALGFYGLGFSALATVAFAIILLVGWEVFEWVIRIVEPSRNVFFDIVIGIAGVGMEVWWHYGLGEPFNLQAFILLAIVTFGLSLWGFIDFRLRGYR